jgi:hypothetical protein
MAYPKKDETKTNASVYDNIASPRRVRVTRTIVFEGPEFWVEDTMKRSWVAPERPLELGVGATVTELTRFVESL